MSTRANIILVDNNGDKLYFYKHSDGYEKHTMPILEKLVDLVKQDKVRAEVGNAGAWLTIIGREEMLAHFNKFYPGENKTHYEGMDWQVGYIEPTTAIHGDIEYLYVVNLQSKIIAVESGYDFTKKDETALIKKTKAVKLTSKIVDEYSLKDTNGVIKGLGIKLC